MQQRGRKGIELLSACVCALAFAGVAWFVMAGRMGAWDERIQSAVFHWRKEAFTPFVVWFSYSGNWQAVTAFVLMLLALPKTRFAYGIPAATASVTSMIFYYGFKNAFCRLRPDACFHLLQQGGYSFPSGHSLTSALLYGTLCSLFVYYRKTGGTPVPRYKNREGAVPHIRSEQRLVSVCLLCFSYVVLMGLSRVYVGVHWPSDVLASWLLAIPVLCGLRRLFGL